MRLYCTFLKTCGDAELFPSVDHDRDSLSDDKSDHRHRLMAFLTQKGVHQFSTQEKVANNALDEGE